MILAETVTMRLPRLYPILDIEALARAGVPLRAAARALAAAEVGIVQLRDKLSAPQQVLEHAAIVSEAFAESACVLVMNDRPDLARLAGWHAIHLGHKDLPPEAARSVFGERPLLVGVSTHDDEQVRAAEGGMADYVALGPVFGTTSKADTEPVVGLAGVRRARQLTQKPLVAIGGITLENAAEVIAAGADSVAVIGALLVGEGGIEARARDFLRRLR